MSDAPLVLVTPLGPNPASLTEAAWALCEAGQPPSRVIVILESEHAQRWLNIEILGEQGMWETLRTACPALPPEHALEIVLAGTDRPDSIRFSEQLFAFLLFVRVPAFKRNC